MTTELEKLKRDMYKQLEEFKYVRAGCAQYMGRFESSMEFYLEALRQEDVSKTVRLNETVKYNEVLVDAYARQQQLTHAALEESRECWTEIYELKAQIHKLESANDRGCSVVMELHEERKAIRDERDELRNKLQAFEFANKSAGELLQAANEKVKRQRGSIGQLKNERNNLRIENGRLKTVIWGRKVLKAVEGACETSKVDTGTSAQSSEEKPACAKCGGASTYSRRPFSDCDWVYTIPCDCVRKDQ